MLQSLIKLMSFIMLMMFITPAFSSQTDMDSLFESLKNAQDETSAREYENKIWLSWFESGDNKIDDLMQQAMRERRGYNFDGALEILNKVISAKPDYPEVWNQRAIVHFFKDDYESSLQDVAKALELEPRHFGAMAGRAMIRMRQLKPALAQQNIIEAIKIHPYLPERKMFPALNK